MRRLFTILAVLLFRLFLPVSAQQQMAVMPVRIPYPDIMQGAILAYPHFDITTCVGATTGGVVANGLANNAVGFGANGGI
jgi:hypothetical protein